MEIIPCPWKVPADTFDGVIGYRLEFRPQRRSSRSEQCGIIEETEGKRVWGSGFRKGLSITKIEFASPDGRTEAGDHFKPSGIENG